LEEKDLNGFIINKVVEINVEASVLKAHVICVSDIVPSPSYEEHGKSNNKVQMNYGTWLIPHTPNTHLVHVNG